MNVWATLGTIAASIVTSIGGVGLLLRYGGDFWLARTKAKWDKELEEFKDLLSSEQRRYQAQLDRFIFVSRSHFDTEFKAIKEVHHCLSELKIPFERLHPFGESILVNAESADLITRLQDANGRFLAKLEEWAVFLEPPQYDEFKRCYEAANHFLEIFPRRGAEMDRDYNFTRAHFWNSYQAACQRARNRIAALAVLPDQ